MKRLAVLVVLALAGCAAPRESPCPRCTAIEQHVKDAEAFMPGYWVRYQTEDLEPTGKPHSPEYEAHRRWIEARDALGRAEGRTKGE